MNFKTIIQFPEITRWSNKLVGLPISQRQLARRTGDMLRGMGHPVFIHSDVNKELDRNTVVINAEYDVDRDELGKRRYIRLTLVVHPKSAKKLKFDDTMSSKFALEILEAMCHEYQHEHQYRAREFELGGDYRSADKDYELREQQEYLGIPDEIDAFAVNIGLRLWLLHGADAKSKITACEAMDYDASPDLWGYFQAFGSDHYITRRLIRKIVKNIDLLDAWKSECIKNGVVGDNKFTLKSITSGPATHNLN